MISRTLEQTAAILDGELINGTKDARLCGVEIDSRRIQPGNLFVPLIGARADGHDFHDAALQKNAAAMLWQKDHPLPETALPLIVVENTLDALQKLAHTYLQETGCKVIGITGSNGKTSCKDLFASVLSRRWKVHKTPGNRNSEIGLPLTILEMDEDCDIIVLEMGMEGFGEIEQLVRIAPVDIAVITSIGSAHLENLGSRENIARAKLEILDGLKENGLFLYPAKSPEIDRVLPEKNVSCPHKQVAFGEGSEVYLESGPTPQADGIVFTTNLCAQPFVIHSFGNFMAENALPVIYACLQMGLTPQEIAQGLAETEITGMRCDVYSIGKAKILDDSYKSNPESAMAAIDTLMSLEGGRHIAVLGDMLDLGPDTQALHASIGTYARQQGVDELFALGPLSRHTAGAFPDGLWFENREELAGRLRPYLDQDVVILIKGSRAMKMDELIGELKKEI